MLQNCLRKFLQIFLVVAFAGKAQALLFQAPTAASAEFEKYALQKNQQTYTQWARSQSESETIEAHPQVVAFSQQALKQGPSPAVLRDWNWLRQSLELNSSDRALLLLLAEKLHQNKELCRALLLEKDLESLLEKTFSTNPCLQKALPLPSAFWGQLEAGDLLSVDGRIFSKEQLPIKLMPGIYQWKILSNQYEDRHFVGSAEEFSKQNFYKQAWVSGNCGDYKLHHPEFAVLLQSQVYFSETCINPGIPPEKTFSNWAADHKALLWGLGILTAGIAASQLKDKKLVITRP